MTTAVVPSSIVNEFLNKQNYEDWSLRVETYLVAKGLWKVVEEATEPPPKPKEKHENWEKSNAEALHAIHLCCGNDAFQVIRGIKLAHKAWNALRDGYRSRYRAEDAETDKNPENETVEGGLQSDDAQPEEDKAEDEIEEEVDQGDGHGDGNISNEETNYKLFFHFAKRKDWNNVMSFLKKHPRAIRVQAPLDGNKTVVHYAVEAQQVVVVKNLLPFITRASDLEITDDEWCSPLDYCYVLPEKDGAAAVEITKCLLKKKEELCGKVDYPSLLVRAYTHHRPKVTNYLYEVIPPKTEDPHFAQLISLSFSTKRFDIACNLIQRYPSLAIAKDLSDNSPLNELASTPSAFLSGSRLKFWENLIYHVISIKPIPTRDVPTQVHGKGKHSDAVHAISIDEPTEEYGKGNPAPTPYGKQSGHMRSVTALFRGLTIENICKIFGLSHIYEMKLSHVRSAEMLGWMCEVLTVEKMKEYEDTKQTRITEFVEAAIFQAAERGLVEFLTTVFRENPHLAKVKNKEGRNLFQVAVQCRQAKVFDLIHGLNKDNRKNIMSNKDHDGNNMLHMMGLSSPFARTNRIRGAALQMQKELQWFKELERMASPEDLEAENHTLDMSPREFFSKNHTELVKEGERSMKETATACTVACALIVTMMFAAAFTLPGGNDDNTGYPKFQLERAFKVFIISDAISLFTSATSVMLFLGILTSRYAEDDFLKVLPRKMILGLLTLFLSVAAMMIAFASALFLILPDEEWIAEPITLLTGIPIASFMWMQFPFLIEIFLSTFILRIFNKNTNVKVNFAKVRFV
ncbi:uncharacterized protein LOC126798481 isoform X2 [Argentina anserina]|uniref:uncharacterized protein LOC126798481 isoform X2 n=1 Tax=Argentina anserina TaxID=57926 RepID=UPI0021764448|nr:uncharacterized protein LOC126798481 isoform X2 [Potentilla anserina]